MGSGAFLGGGRSTTGSISVPVSFPSSAPIVAEIQEKSEVGRSIGTRMVLMAVGGTKRDVAGGDGGGGSVGLSCGAEKERGSAKLAGAAMISSGVSPWAAQCAARCIRARTDLPERWRLGLPLWPRGTMRRPLGRRAGRSSYGVYSTVHIVLEAVARSHCVERGPRRQWGEGQSHADAWRRGQARFTSFQNLLVPRPSAAPGPYSAHQTPCQGSIHCRYLI